MNAKLEDIKKELWLRMRNEGQIVWTVKAGQEIPIKDMTTAHLINTYNMLLRNANRIEITKSEEESFNDDTFGIDSTDLQL